MNRLVGFALAALVAVSVFLGGGLQVATAYAKVPECGTPTTPPCP